MSQTISGNEWGQIRHHASTGVLELQWRDGEMSDNGFMATLALLALEAERVRPTAIVVDARTFHHTFGPGIMDWRSAAILPRYGAAGVRRFAFVVPAGSPPMVARPSRDRRSSRRRGSTHTTEPSPGFRRGAQYDADHRGRTRNVGQLRRVHRCRVAPRRAMGTGGRAAGAGAAARRHVALQLVSA